MLAGMVLVFQMPTAVFFLAKMRMVTARFMARHIKYAILIIFIAAAVLTRRAIRGTSWCSRRRWSPSI